VKEKGRRRRMRRRRRRRRRKLQTRILISVMFCCNFNLRDVSPDYDRYLLAHRADTHTHTHVCVYA